MTATWDEAVVKMLVEGIELEAGGLLRAAHLLDHYRMVGHIQERFALLSETEVGAEDRRRLAAMSLSNIRVQIQSIRVHAENASKAATLLWDLLDEFEHDSEVKP